MFNVLQLFGFKISNLICLINFKIVKFSFLSNFQNIFHIITFAKIVPIKFDKIIIILKKDY